MSKFDKRHGSLASLLEQAVRGDGDQFIFAPRRMPPGFGKAPRDKDEPRASALSNEG